MLSKYEIGVLDVGAGSETYTDVSTYATSMTFDSLTPGKLYQVRIRAANLVGNSAWSSYVDCYPGIVPTRPGTIAFSSPTRNSLTLTWSAISSDDTGGTSSEPIGVTAYHLYMDNGYGGDFELKTSTGDSTVSYTVEYLTPGIFYQFYLTVENDIGLTSSPSAVHSMMSGTTVSAPGIPTLVEQSSTSISVEWEEPFDNGGTSITEYELTWTKVSDSGTTVFSIVNANSHTFTTSDGLVAGEEYTAVVVASNYVTEYFSLTSTSSATGTFYSSDNPSAVTDLSASSLTKTDVTLNWSLHSAAADQGYSTTDPTYRLEMDDCNGGAFGIVLNQDSTSTSFDIEGMTPG